MIYLGYIGTLLLALCSLPLLIRTIKDGHCRGIDGVFLACWWLGEEAMLGYVSAVTPTYPLVLNYLANVLMVGVIGAYKVFR